MTRMSSKDSPMKSAAPVGDPIPSGRVARALEIHRSIAACHAYMARSDSVHALTAALMLPCYQAEFRSLALELTPVEDNELRSVLRAPWELAVTAEHGRRRGWRSDTK
ncbi:MAG: hypothetical protein NVS3B2_16100 [Ramlibacter sp.]